MPSSRKPRSFPLDEAKAASGTKSAPKKSRKPKATPPDQTVTFISDDAANGLTNQLQPTLPHPAPGPNRAGLGALLLATTIALVSLAIGIALDNLVRELFVRHAWLGWLGVAVSALFCLLLLGLIVREAVALARMRKISSLREQSEIARKTDNLKLAKQTVGQLTRLIAVNPASAKARANLEVHAREVTGGADLIQIAEQELFKPADRQAVQLIMNAAKRVSVVTAVSPRAIVDIVYVLMENLRLIRALSQLYGGRPGIWGLMRLAKNVVTHLAATGAIAVGDGLLQQFVGHGLAARLSTRLGEGVLNGLLTARIGISAMDICRPMPFHALKRPSVGDFISELVALNGADGPAKSDANKL